MFDFKVFNWKEATSDENGKSSVGLFICFWYGLALVILTGLAGTAYFVKWIEKSDINNVFIFIGVQMPLTLTYLFGRSALKKNDNAKSTTTTTNTQTIETK